MNSVFTTHREPCGSKYKEVKSQLTILSTESVVQGEGVGMVQGEGVGMAHGLLGPHHVRH